MKEVKNIFKVILVLNSDYTPLDTVNFKRAYRLIYKEKAQVITSDNSRIVYKDICYPTVIRLTKYVNAPYKKVLLSRLNVFKRDKYICAYCGGKNNLTVDHIIPKYHGGKNTWENLITCCFRCNNKKDNRTPEEAGLKLLYKPYKPNYFFFFNTNIKKDWEPYLFTN